MKKLFTFFLILTLVYSCSNSSDENGDTTSVPFPPTNLTGTIVSSTQLNLFWTDNSTDETGFKIERKTLNGTYEVVGTTSSNINTFNNTGLTTNTTYVYRVYSYNSGGNSPTYSNEITLTTTALPTITTTVASEISQITAISGGNISNDGGANITLRGVCWSTSPNPTIALTTKTNDGSGIGSFISNLTGLTINTIYYARAYATNSVGTAYGNEVSFTTGGPGQNVSDTDGNIYQTVIICNQTFTKSNLNVSKYNDGTPIPQATNSTQWANLTTGAWCYYNFDPANANIYGKLYNWYAVKGIYDGASATNPALRKQLAPIGWHIPSNDEWIQLRNCLGGELVAGGKMKSIGTSLWQAPNTAANNESGFTGFPCGFNNLIGTFSSFGSTGSWWLSTEVSTSNAYYAHLNWNSATAFINGLGKGHGFSVRCIKD
ncbi:MAG: hypothetical protein RL259_1365 [Bacteroidota bacterium]|jgi:uncharacterized protein (TIGR02145 family)